MKRIVLFVLFSSFFAISAFSQTLDINQIIETEVNLEALSNLNPSELDELIESGKYIILDGTVSSIMDIERSDTNLILDIHLVSGRWIGLDKVENYKCIVNVNGKEWEYRFPQRRPRTVTDDHILQNYHIMVIGPVTSYVMDNSELKAVVDAKHIRRIQ